MTVDDNTQHPTPARIFHCFGFIYIYMCVTIYADSHPSLCQETYYRSVNSHNCSNPADQSGDGTEMGHGGPHFLRLSLGLTDLRFDLFTSLGLQ